MKNRMNIRFRVIRLLLLSVMVLLMACSAPAAMAASGLGTQNVRKGATVTFGSYEQDGNFSNGQEPIRWIVLERKGNRALLLSRYGLDAQPYDTVSGAVNWSSCYLRAWLQSDFYNTAFTSDQQRAIVTVKNATPVNSKNSGGPGPDTYDTVFLLSSAEVNKYLPDKASRAVKATSYALMMGAEPKVSGNSYWWLRSYADAKRQLVLMINSECNVYASYIVDYGAVVRPAVWVDVTK